MTHCSGDAMGTLGNRRELEMLETRSENNIEIVSVFYVKDEMYCAVWLLKPNTQFSNILTGIFTKTYRNQSYFIGVTRVNFYGPSKKIVATTTNTYGRASEQQRKDLHHLHTELVTQTRA